MARLARATARKTVAAKPVAKPAKDKDETPKPRRAKKERTLEDVIELLHRHGIRFRDEED